MVKGRIGGNVKNGFFIRGFLLLFLPLTFLVYYNPIIINRTYRNVCLLIASLLFYAWGEPKFVFVMLLSIVVNWGLTLLMDKCRGSFARKFIFALLLALDIGVLFVYKYLNFTVENLNRIPFIQISVQNILLPIGISFYTFQIMSYVIDIYRGGIRIYQFIGCSPIHFNVSAADRGPHCKIFHDMSRDKESVRKLEGFYNWN